MKTILVVEDEKMIRQGIVVMIRRSGVPVEQILECRNGEEALQILKEQKVDVMFTDIRMPKMDGLTLVARVDEMEEKPLIIVVSGYDEFSYAVEMMKHGVMDYILKPIKREVIDELMQKLQKKLSMNQVEKQEEERIFLNQLRYFMMNPDQVQDNCWQDLETRIRNYIGEGSFRLGMTSSREKERISCEGSIVLDEVEGGVLYFLPEPEAQRLMAEKDERFCMGFSSAHRSVLEIPKAYQEALSARTVAFFCIRPVEVYQEYVFGEKPELAMFREQFLLQIPSEKIEYAIKKLKNWFFEGMHQLVSPFQLLYVTEEICRELNRLNHNSENPCPMPLHFRDAESFLAEFEIWVRAWGKEVEEQKFGSQGEEKMKAAIAYIRENYAKDLNMATVSNYVCMNYSLFSTAFKEYTGVNFVNYLKEIRIMEAKRLLSQTDEKISDIGKMVGYENDKHFMKTFKSICGVSPSEYRKDARILSNTRETEGEHRETES